MNPTEEPQKRHLKLMSSRGNVKGGGPKRYVGGRGGGGKKRKQEMILLEKKQKEVPIQRHLKTISLDYPCHLGGVRS